MNGKNVASYYAFCAGTVETESLIRSCLSIIQYDSEICLYYQLNAHMFYSVIHVLH
jgi:hypothetical protein